MSDHLNMKNMLRIEHALAADTNFKLYSTQVFKIMQHLKFSLTFRNRHVISYLMLVRVTM